MCNQTGIFFDFLTKVTRTVALTLKTKSVTDFVPVCGHCVYIIKAVRDRVARDREREGIIYPCPLSFERHAPVDTSQIFVAAAGDKLAVGRKRHRVDAML